MFNFFKKKKNTSTSKIQDMMNQDMIVFKSSEAAFEMSSKFMVNNLAPNEFVMAIVLSELDQDR